MKRMEFPRDWKKGKVVLLPKQDFEEMTELCAWSDVQRVIYAKRLLRGSARLLLIGLLPREQI
ncbi:hypothetical protein WH47_04713 [Habropoda laboriosa]|uniref:Uncharacterized protein n=1 Tax=Habropoda laboriosa TaxID=597456 RepID=A0A0L7QXS9_9HYME|nr:hypothetical protein WH47_04713 [Habropoda laboriosa]